MSNPLCFTATGEGPPLVLLHGFTGDASTLRSLSHALADRFTVYSVDLPGHGRTGHLSDIGLYDFLATVDLLADFFEERNLNAAAVLGYSMGGRLALALSLNYPHLVSQLTLIGASAGLASQSERLARRQADSSLADELLEDGLPAFVDRWMTQPLFASQQGLAADVLAAARQQRLANDPVGLAASLRGAGTGAQPSLWGRLSEISASTLLLVGEQDTKFRRLAMRLSTGLSQSETVVIAQAGHAVHVENPQATVAALREFLSTNHD
ncbi:MAG: 2-succinyl-6-hydroxy-2,4-cyclohexadiene-1-carboxylate synthase [Actinobacteria bacterium]|jgi:2-succinyl-6-hydroxy-2,4-cyclohexadiene-1-carboxylate synthase|nr:2-succinyl-6-hydroxy-2,4-cyclohexadiene-1-carboxylate synthase [Actinomycetota bacterium]MBT3746598.1 2-succinyl-6-hydroxy-2,4-cyclohexadiene-1-carboxylate synthase [Actinomycetota bacterium]MBT3969138.1 2-succinyl-6-hydroxy-2,4-cyclohexadiene-1-carboxylate synthase [Actinomycetota bacterium]MBT4010052.1 2-succinyl-6-hydroxy-2,4-cyclohexadiene-1-carboxylate synthase [Actinomycetota bacterium]MBT4476756.1 2-succinyl-6-hydroxy-2,4-cyclohexadiene-1-carboxylate synthase [Actinomycetota bacterium